MKVYLLFLVLLLCSVAYADMKLDTVKVYVESDAVSGVDKEGGTIKVMPGNILEFQINVDNNMNNISQAKLKGVISDIDDGDDITKTQDYYDIQPNDDRTKTLSFTIPDNAEKDNYDMTLTVYYTPYNQSESKWEIDYTIQVKETTEETTEFDVKYALTNMSHICTNLAGNLNSCFGYINKSSEYYDKFSTCQEEKGTKEQNANDYKKDTDMAIKERDACKTELTQKESDLSICNNEKSNMVTEASCLEREKKATEKSSSSNTTNIMMVIGGGLIIWYFANQNKKKRNVASSIESLKRERGIL